MLTLVPQDTYAQLGQASLSSVLLAITARDVTGRSTRNCALKDITVLLALRFLKSVDLKLSAQKDQPWTAPVACFPKTAFQVSISTSTSASLVNLVSSVSSTLLRSIPSTWKARVVTNVLPATTAQVVSLKAASTSALQVPIDSKLEVKALMTAILVPMAPPILSLDQKIVSFAVEAPPIAKIEPHVSAMDSLTLGKRLPTHASARQVMKSLFTPRDSRVQLKIWIAVLFLLPSADLLSSLTSTTNVFQRAHAKKKPSVMEKLLKRILLGSLSVTTIPLSTDASAGTSILTPPTTVTPLAKTSLSRPTFFKMATSSSKPALNQEPSLRMPSETPSSLQLSSATSPSA